MQSIKCPHCGAPPPFPLNNKGQFGYACPYCRQHSVLGEPEPEPPPQAPAIIVLHHGGHDHDDHHYHQAVAHANVARSVSWIVWVVVVLVVTLGGSAGALMKCGRHSTVLSGLVWDGTEPFHCTGNDDVSVSGVEAHFNAGSAVSATGNCHFRCTDCKVSAPTAIEATGNAQVTFVNGTVTGTAVLADASGNARVTISGNVTASGRTRETGNAKVSAPPPPAVPAATDTAPPTATTAAPTTTTPPAAAKAAAPAVKPAAKPTAPAKSATPPKK